MPNRRAEWIVILIAAFVVFLVLHYHAAYWLKVFWHPQ